MFHFNCSSDILHVRIFSENFYDVLQQKHLLHGETFVYMIEYNIVFFFLFKAIVDLYIKQVYMQ